MTVKPGYRNPESWSLRDALRDLIPEARRGNISDRYPHRATDLFEALTSDWGSVGQRRLWRTLWWLLARGFVVRVGTAHNGSSYARGYAPETPWDNAERTLVALKESRRCFDCRDRLDPQRPDWCGPRCAQCELDRRLLWKQEHREALEQAKICVECARRAPEAPWKRCTECLEAGRQRYQDKRRAA